MAKRRRRYTEEFKREAVRLYESSGKTQVQIEAELGIGSGLPSDPDVQGAGGIA